MLVQQLVMASKLLSTLKTTILVQLLLLHLAADHWSLEDTQGISCLDASNLCCVHKALYKLALLGEQLRMQSHLHIPFFSTKPA